MNYTTFEGMLEARLQATPYFSIYLVSAVLTFKQVSILLAVQQGLPT